jgi:hypothetical protein
MRRYTRKQKKQTRGSLQKTKGSQKQKRQKKQKGGFYPSVAGGIANAIYLTPLAIRAGMKLFNNRRKQTRKH